jgi:hypothetical protein
VQRWERWYRNRNQDEEALDVRQTADGGYILSGSKQSRMWLVKCDSSGDTTWTRVLIPWERYHGSGRAVAQTTDGGYTVVGSYVRETPPESVLMYLVRTDSLGDTLWTRKFGRDSAWSWAHDVEQTPDGGFIVLGSIDLPPDRIEATFAVRCNSQGDTLWTRAYAAPVGRNGQSGWALSLTRDGGLIVCGSTAPTPWESDAYLLRLDGNGDSLWFRTYGRPINNESFVQVRTLPDGGFLAAGGCEGGYAYVVRTDSLGNALWTRTYGGDPACWCNGLWVTTDGTYVIAGGKNPVGGSLISDGWLLHIDKNSFVLWERTYGGFPYDILWSVQQTRDGGFVTCGKTNTPPAVYDLWVVKTDAGGSSGLTEGHRAEPLRPGLQVECPDANTVRYFLPLDSPARLAVHDVTGRNLGRYELGNECAGWHEVPLRWLSLSSGAYFVRLSTATDAAVARIVVAGR